MSAPAARAGESRRIPPIKLTLEQATAIAACTLLAWLVLYPLAVLVIGSLRTDLPMRAGRFTLANFLTLFGEPANQQAILNTFISSVTVS